jgi:hypothetical protein
VQSAGLANIPSTKIIATLDALLTVTETLARLSGAVEKGSATPVKVVKGPEVVVAEGIPSQHPL